MKLEDVVKALESRKDFGDEINLIIAHGAWVEILYSNGNNLVVGIGGASDSYSTIRTEEELNKRLDDVISCAKLNLKHMFEKEENK